VIGLFLGWNTGSAAYTSRWWASWLNGWRPTAAQVWFEPATSGLLVLALLMLVGRAMVGWSARTGGLPGFKCRPADKSALKQVHQVREWFRLL